MKVKTLEGENTDQKKNQKQKKFLLISEIKHFKGPSPQWHKRQKCLCLRNIYLYSHAYTDLR